MCNAKYSIVVAILLCATFSAVAQSSHTIALDVFNKKKYSSYLADIPAEIAPVIINPASEFDRLVALAIALEKTGSWNGECAKLAREMLAKTPDALRYLDGLKLVLDGDTHGLTKIYEGKPPDRYALMKAPHLLHDHGYPLAEHCMNSVAPNPIGECVYEWMSIPKVQRGPVDEVMFKLLKGTAKTEAASSAVGFYVSATDKSPYVADECLQLALQLGGEKEAYSLQAINALCMRKKATEALHILKEAEKRDPENAELPYHTAGELSNFDCYTEALTVYRDSLRTLSSPRVRIMRLGYLDYLQYLQKAKIKVDGAETLAALCDNADPLLATDARLVLGETLVAGKRYASLVKDTNQKLGIRLDAWSGLISSDPVAALDTAPGLLREISALDSVVRRPYFLWYGNCLRAALEQADHWIPTDTQVDTFMHVAKPISDAPGWENIVADLFTRMLEIDAVSCLRPEPDAFNPSLRNAIVCAYLQANRPTQAAEILSRHLEYDISPPPGGWIIDGTAIPDADKPQHRVTPLGVETPMMLDQIVLKVRQTQNLKFENSMIKVELLAARDYVRALKNPQTLFPGSVDFKIGAQQVVFLAHMLRDAQFLLSPSSMTTDGQHLTGVTDDQITLLNTTVHEALTIELIAQNASSMIAVPDGVAMNVLAAHDTRMKDIAFGLVTQILDRYAIVVSQEAASSEAEQNAKIFDEYNLNTYAKKLRERYPTPK